MKKRVFLAVVSLTLVGVGILVWLKDRREATPSASKTAAATSVGAQSARQSPPVLPARSASSTVQQGTLSEKLSPQERRREIVNAWEQAREKEVEFWGKVIDQHNEPVTGVTVTATVTTHQILPPNYKPQPTTIYSATTDAAGLFYIKARAGRGFTIETMERLGYILSPELQKRRGNLFGFNYDQLDPTSFRPDHGAPVVFHMWKVGAPALLIAHEEDTRIPYDGTAVNYDLLTGRKTASGGDIRVTLIRSPQKIQWGQRNFEWTATIEAVDGGLVESADEFMYLAPEDGYQPKVMVHMRPDDPKWTDEKAVEFYLKSRGGKNYGRVRLEFMTGSDKPTTGFSFRSCINPNGSRNLEYDPRGLTKS